MPAIVISGVVIAITFIVAALVIIMTRTLRPRRIMMLGLITIPVAVAPLVTAQHTGSMTMMLMSASVAGMSAALGYRHAIQGSQWQFCFEIRWTIVEKIVTSKKPP